MSNKIFSFLKHDLTNGLPRRTERMLALGIVALSAVSAVMAVTNMWNLAMVTLPIALCAALVALRIDGPQNARSFRVNRTNGAVRL